MNAELADIRALRVWPNPILPPLPPPPPVQFPAVAHRFWWPRTPIGAAMDALAAYYLTQIWELPRWLDLNVWFDDPLADVRAELQTYLDDRDVTAEHTESARSALQKGPQQ